MSEKYSFQFKSTSDLLTIAFLFIQNVEKKQQLRSKSILYSLAAAARFP